MVITSLLLKRSTLKFISVLVYRDLTNVMFAQCLLKRRVILKIILLLILYKALTIVMFVAMYKDLTNEMFVECLLKRRVILKIILLLILYKVLTIVMIVAIPCLKLALSKALGYGIIAGSVMASSFEVTATIGQSARPASIHCICVHTASRAVWTQTHH
uniref:Uncharacterized protein n=1 Tax=Timema cristinae TaxID=61476 RepID=A0A7R9CK44_TIMCR|nr:unnamed protein product [Timema cristinae]